MRNITLKTILCTIVLSFGASANPNIEFESTAQAIPSAQQIQACADEYYPQFLNHNELYERSYVEHVICPSIVLSRMVRYYSYSQNSTVRPVRNAGNINGEHMRSCLAFTLGLSNGIPGWCVDYPEYVRAVTAKNAADTQQCLVSFLGQYHASLDPEEYSLYQQGLAAVHATAALCLDPESLTKFKNASNPNRVHNNFFTCLDNPENVFAPVSDCFHQSYNN